MSRGRDAIPIRRSPGRISLPFHRLGWLSLMVGCLLALGSLSESASARASAQNPPEARPATLPGIDGLGWLAGTWVGEKDGGRMEEQWTPPAGGTMLATSRIVAGGKTVIFEFLRLSEQDGAVTLTAYPNGSAGTPFRMVRQGPAEAVFENTGHDFPKRILYRRLPGKRLEARIEGLLDGKETGVDFHFTLAGAPSPEPAGMRAIHQEALVPAPPGEVWAAWTSTAGVTTFFAPAAKIELRPGGAYELYFDPTGAEGLRGSEGMRVLAFVPGEMLSFEWNAPPHLPEVRREKTWVVLRFAPAGVGQTRVTLDHLGWRDGAQWDQAFDYFTRAWDVVLGRLVKRFQDGPATWK